MVKFNYNCPICGNIELDGLDKYFCRCCLVKIHYEAHLDELKQVHDAFPHGWHHAHL